MADIWLTSDSHFNHDRLFVWQARGFSSVDEMNEAIIERWNSVIKPDDIVYHLGDVMLGQDNAAGVELIKRLNGNLYLAYGNHDTDNRIYEYSINNLFKNIQFGYRVRMHKRICVLTHYPTIVSNESGPKILNFFGHTHQTTSFYTDEAGTRSFMYNVGMDAHNCAPVNIEDIVTEIKKLGEE